ncbi:putative homoserine kinase type II (protein kinase fold) [Rhizobium leguminosarum bv. trifolii WSM2297]|uniref:Putative homoserine kinase type II (Protein kinase fold) n=1 Tax=Rhizobium leguminosarum bv. trifolii WSM2297 TaxID=754762 RepID=J0CJC4_RHILT|nr:phosphotransferase [Rhizobium leguminosarum]EJC83752.1 putative homoserine kinase type II (protein kinase fold) [Rhizobium leguminosarum bv. trifolii WSM2297]EJC84657.1 putative homoserine kinase type II (protein kinase fold) [Rhizobium leguminosarum bv. trifolii WSM2297]
MSACNDAVPDDGAGHLGGNQSVGEPFTEAYFRAAAAVMATKPSPAEARASSELLLRHYGLTGTVKVLSSEVECTAEVTLSSGDRLILKTSARPEGRDSFRFQVAALAGLEGASGFAAPHLVRTGGGTPMFEEEEICGYLQTRLSGVPLHQANATPDVLYRVGQALGRLSLALGALKLPAIHRPVLWHVGCWPRLMELEEHLPSRPMAESVRLAMSNYVELIAPQLREVAWQVTHNDPSPFNTLLTGRDIAFIDFGDGCWGPRIQDLVVAASHLVTDPSSALGGSENLIAGYASVTPLTTLEIKLLVGLIKARQSALVLINYWRAQLFPAEAAYIKKNVARAERGLSILSALSLGEAETVVRRAGL